MVDDISMDGAHKNEESKDLDPNLVSILRNDNKQVVFKPYNDFTKKALRRVQHNSQKFDFKAKAL